jgi:hypothetical protein
MTQPTPQTQPRDRRALSHLTHGLTGKRIYLFGEDEQQAYDELCRGMRESLQPAGEAETQLTQEICDDSWRLRRAANFESAIFADAADQFAADPEKSTGDLNIDRALSDAETWIAESRNFNLLSLYEGRIHRRRERNMAELRRLQAERRAALEAAVAEAAILAQAAEATGEKADTGAPFLRRHLEFSAFEMARMIDRHRRFEEAKKFIAASKKALRRAA